MLLVSFDATVVLVNVQRSEHSREEESLRRTVVFMDMWGCFVFEYKTCLRQMSSILMETAATHARTHACTHERTLVLQSSMDPLSYYIDIIYVIDWTTAS